MLLWPDPPGRFSLRLTDELESPAVLGLASPRIQTLADSEIECIVRGLEATHWQIEGQDGAATALDVPSSTLRKRMQKHGIHRPPKLKLRSTGNED